MTHFLWVEDFKASEPKDREPNIVSSTVRLVFGSILDDKELTKELEEEDEKDACDSLEKKGIFLKLNLLEALDFIHNPNELAKVDFVVLDVDMPLKRDGQPDNNNHLPDLIKKYQSETELKKIAGYQIYIDLVIELGFPKSHILFCSNHAGYFEEFTARFESSNIKFPKLLQKEHKEEIKDWLTEAHSDYFVLRRGIIQACQYLKTLSEDKLQFNDFIQYSEKKISLDDIHNYLDVLENFLPLREPDNKANLYKLFIRTLAHEWEAAIKQSESRKINCKKETHAFYRIMKTTRNWVAHNANAIFDKLTEQDVAYLFLCNMRSMFELNDNCVLDYEKKLFSLFAVTTKPDMKKIIGTSTENRQLKFALSYTDFFKKSEIERANFLDALNILQEKPIEVTDKGSLFFIRGLYLSFWFLTSDGYYPKSSKDRKNSSDEMFLYRFNYFDYSKTSVYSKTSFLFEFSRHIYNYSFPHVENNGQLDKMRL